MILDSNITPKKLGEGPRYGSSGLHKASKDSGEAVMVNGAMIERRTRLIVQLMMIDQCCRKRGASMVPPTMVPMMTGCHC